MIGLALLTFLLVNITWVFFRAKTFAGAGMVLRAWPECRPSRSR